jgi:phosphoribosyl 1,2-cyclic phosphodiesterase
MAQRLPALEDLFRPQTPGRGVELGPVWVESFPTPHDAAGSVGYSISAHGRRMALCTDLGHVTPEVLDAVLGCDLLLCETNHDEDWLRSGPYPYPLKSRILGAYGHLSNEAGAELAAKAVEAGAGTIILGHLSAENNTPARAREAVCRRLRAMDCDPERDISLTVAPRTERGPIWRVAPHVSPLEQEGALC